MIFRGSTLIKAILEETDTHIVIPEGCSKIGCRVFADHPNITHITLPSSVHLICEQAFNRCSMLQEINLEHVVCIEYRAFGYTDLRSADLSSATQIAKNAFVCCAHLEQVVISEDLHEISAGTFEGCSKLNNVDLKHVEIIGTAAFRNCKSLQNIQMDHVKTVQNAAFADCPAASQQNLYYADDHVEFPFIDSVYKDDTHFKWFGSRVYGRIPKENQSDIQCLQISEDTVVVDYDTFSDCTNLETVILHDCLEIRPGAFKHCPRLKYLVIPDYNPETCRFIFDEYDDGWGASFKYNDPDAHYPAYQYFNYVGETELRNEDMLQKMAQSDNPSSYFCKHWLGDPDIIFCSHWIRINYFAFDRFIDLKILSVPPQYPEILTV